METIQSKQQNKPLIDVKAGKIQLGLILISMVLVLSGLSGILPATLISFGVVACCAMLFLMTQEIYLVFPVMLFYGNVLGMFFGISVYRLYTLILVVAALLKSQHARMQITQLLVLVLFVIYCFAVIMPDSLQRAVFSIFDMLSILLLINCYLKDLANLRRFFMVFVISSFLAYFTGMQTETVSRMVIISGELVELTRNTATFEDPNYMGFFYTCAVFATVSLRLFSKKLRVVAVVALYAILLTSLSISTILINILLWIFYLLLTRPVNRKVVWGTLVVIVVAVGLYQYGLANPEETTVGMLATRIEEKIAQLETGNYNDATSNRTGLYRKHFTYFLQQPVYKMFIGMNAASPLKTDLNGMRVAGHNEYVDWLLNVGLIGTLIMVAHLFSSTWKPLKAYLKNKQSRELICVVLIKCTWIFYAISLTLYGDYRFMLMFLM